jgi:hypothetical protein
VPPSSQNGEEKMTLPASEAYLFRRKGCCLYSLFIARRVLFAGHLADSSPARTEPLANLTIQSNSPPIYFWFKNWRTSPHIPGKSLHTLHVGSLHWLDNLQEIEEMFPGPGDHVGTPVAH